MRQTPDAASVSKASWYMEQYCNFGWCVGQHQVSIDFTSERLAQVDRIVSLVVTITGSSVCEYKVAHSIPVTAPLGIPSS
eukprot:993477-Pyramimonas_sp.AAC.2